jgi:hypothetical protein
MTTSLSDAGLTFADGNTQPSPVVSVRQTVLSGPVDTNGFAAFGGSTGSTTVTTSGTIVATAAQANTNRTGTKVNPSFTGLSTNGTMYLYVDVNADGTLTEGVGTLAPIYQWGGTPATTSGLFTFNIQQMTGYIGNGSTAPAGYRVYLGEATVAGAVVTAIVWYALMGRYDSGFTATLPGGSLTSRNSNLGVADQDASLIAECTTADQGYVVGDRLDMSTDNPGSSGNFSAVPLITTRNTVAFSKGMATYYANQKGANVPIGLTNSSWKYKLITKRSWL